MQKHYLSKLIACLVMICLASGALKAQPNATVVVNAPANVSGNYDALQAVFGPGITADITADVVEAVDTAGLTTVCDSIATDLTGAIALVDRGACAFTQKVLNAQTKGAVAVIVCNSNTAVPTQAIAMGGTEPLVTIPSVMIPYAQCQTIRAELGNGLNVTLTTTVDPPLANELCTEATVITAGTTTVDTVASGYGAVFGGASNAVWYSYTPAADGLITVRSCGLSDVDTRVVILGGPDCDLANLVVVATNDDCDPDNNNFASETSFLAIGGTRYFVYWDDPWSNNGFDFEIVEEALPAVDVTISVDMSNETVSGDGVNLFWSTAQGGGLNVAPMSDNGDGTWSATVGLTALDSLGYLFLNGAADLANAETVPEDCGFANPVFPGTLVRGLVVTATEAFSLPAVCFSGCGLCPDLTCGTLPLLVDDFEGYAVGDGIAASSDDWVQWEFAGSMDVFVTDEQAASGSNSLLVPDGSLADVVMLLGNQTSGSYRVEWKTYIPAGATGYWNIQEDETPGVAWNMNVFYNEDSGAPGTGNVQETGTTFTYPEDAWFDVAIYVDLDNDALSLLIDGVLVDELDYPNNLGSINFFSIDANNRYYIDDVAHYSVTPAEACGDVLFADGLEFYSDGSTSGAQSSIWTTWSGDEGGADDGIVTMEQAATGCNSLLIAEGQTQDALLLLGNQTEGNYQVKWKTYVPAGATAYWNIQEDEAPGVAWNMDVFYNEDGAAPGEGNVQQSGNTFTYPEDEWFDVILSVDLDNATATLSIAGQLVESAYAYPGAQLGAINFFSIDATNRYYLDDVQMSVLEPCSEDAIICDAVEYPADTPISPYTDYWTTWSGTEGGADDGIVSTDQAHSGCSSMLIAEAQVQDVLLLLGNQTEGRYGLSWWAYVPTGATAYFNIQEDEMPGVAWNLEVNFNEDGGAPGVGTIDQVPGTTFTYPEDQWFQVVLDVDLDNDILDFNVDGGVALDDFAYPGSLGAINFFSIDATNRYYIDDVLYEELPPAVVTVTFSVEMTLTPASAEGVFLSGSFNGWPNPGEPMTEGMDNIWSVTLAVAANTTHEYKFQNGTDGWEDGIPTDCTLGDFGNRFVETVAEDIDLESVCFNACVMCIDATSNESLLEGVSVYPNPTNDVLNLDIDLTEATDALNVRLINTLGQVVYNNVLGRIQTESVRIDVSNMAAGAYMLHISDGEAQLTKSVIIE